MEVLIWISRSGRLEKLGAVPCICDEGGGVGTLDLNCSILRWKKSLFISTLGPVKANEQAPTVFLIHFTIQEHLGTFSSYITR